MELLDFQTFLLCCIENIPDIKFFEGIDSGLLDFTIVFIQLSFNCFFQFIHCIECAGFCGNLDYRVMLPVMKDNICKFIFLFRFYIIPEERILKTNKLIVKTFFIIFKIICCNHKTHFSQFTIKLNLFSSINKKNIFTFQLIFLPCNS